MRRIAPILLLLAPAACVSDPPPAPAKPRPVASPVTSTAPAPRQVSPASAARGGYAQDVDDLFRALDAEDGRPAPAQARGPSQPTRKVIYVIAPVSPERAVGEAQEAQQRAYEENLTGCLDGRFPAFCDHAQLTPYDAARVQQAEYEANLATCLDPAWQHLCRPELMPLSYGSEASTPAAPDERTAPATLAPFDAVPGGASIRTSAPTQAAASVPRFTPTLPRVSSGATAAVPVQPSAVQTTAPTWQPVVAPPPSSVRGCSESGSCYGDISTLTGQPKTTYVRGYFRRNGTYVRSYYRSTERR